MKRAVLFMLRILTATMLIWMAGFVPALIPSASAAGKNAKTAIEYIPDGETVLFDQDGVKLMLTGEVEDKGVTDLKLKVRFENHTDKDLELAYQGTVNGKKLKKKTMLRSRAEAGKVSEPAISLNYGDLGLLRFSDLREMKLDFMIQITETINRITDNIHDPSSDLPANRHRNRSSGSDRLHPSTQTISGIHRHTTRRLLTDMLLNLNY